MTKCGSAMLLAAALLVSSVAGAATQSLESIRDAAAQFVRAQLPPSSVKHYVEAGALDARLRLAACNEPLQTFAQSSLENSARMTVGVRCASLNTWTLYVPVAVEVDAPVLVLRRPLARRARVAQTDVEPQVRRVPGVAANFVSDMGSLAGHRLKRSLPAGTALTVEMLQPDLLVRRGQHVTLVAHSGPVQIRAQGLALTDGAESERVRVQNVTSLKVVEGVVESGAIVRVGP